MQFFMFAFSICRDKLPPSFLPWETRILSGAFCDRDGPCCRPFSGYRTELLENKTPYSVAAGDSFREMVASAWTWGALASLVGDGFRVYHCVAIAAPPEAFAALSNPPAAPEPLAAWAGRSRSQSGWNFLQTECEFNAGVACGGQVRIDLPYLFWTIVHAYWRVPWIAVFVPEYSEAADNFMTEACFQDGEMSCHARCGSVFRGEYYEAQLRGRAGPRPPDPRVSARKAHYCVHAHLSGLPAFREVLPAEIESRLVQQAAADSNLPAACRAAVSALRALKQWCAL